MSHLNRDDVRVARFRPLGRLIVGMLVVQLLAGVAVAATDGWRHFRRMQFPDGLPEGPVAVALDAAVIEKCRPDLADVRVVSGNGVALPITVEQASQNTSPEVVPARISRIARRPGSWTDISIDKSGKILTRGVTILTPAKDFVRRVELRGSDNGRELYVVRMDGLIVGRSKPIPVRSLTIDHPVNNFQYLHVRILDQNQPPLKIDGVVCESPVEEDRFSTPLSVRVIENRTDASRNAAVIVADLGERRFPLKSIKIATRAKSFVKQYTLSGSSSPSSESWGKISDGTFFRVRHEDAIKEQLTAVFPPLPVRFLMLEITGPDSPPLEVDELRASGQVSYVVFHYKPGEEFRLFYDNPAAQPRPADESLPRLTLQLASASSAIRLGHAEKNVASPTEKKWEPSHTADRSYGLLEALGVAVCVLVVLSILGIVVRRRRLKKSLSQRTSRIYTKVRSVR